MGAHAALLYGASNTVSPNGVPPRGMLVIGGEVKLDPRIYLQIGDAQGKRPTENLYLGSGAVLAFDAADSTTKLIAGEGTSVRFAPGSIFWASDRYDPTYLNSLAERIDVREAELKGLEMLEVRWMAEAEEPTAGHFVQNPDGTLRLEIGERRFSGAFAETLQNVDPEKTGSWFRNYYSIASSFDISKTFEAMATIPMTNGGAESVLGATKLPVAALRRWLEPGHYPVVAAPSDEADGKEETIADKMNPFRKLPTYVRQSPIEVTVGSIDGEGDISGALLYEGASTDISGGFVRLDAVGRKDDWLMGLTLEGRDEEEKVFGVMRYTGERTTLGVQAWVAKELPYGALQLALGWGASDEDVDIVAGDAFVRANVKESLFTLGLTGLTRPVAGSSAFFGVRAVRMEAADADFEANGQTFMKTETDASTFGVFSAGVVGSADYAWESANRGWLPRSASFTWELSGEWRSDDARTSTSRLDGSDVPAKMHLKYISDHAVRAEVGAALHWKESSLALTASTERGDQSERTSCGVRLTWFPML